MLINFIFILYKLTVIIFNIFNLIKNRYLNIHNMFFLFIDIFIFVLVL